MCQHWLLILSSAIIVDQILRQEPRDYNCSSQLAELGLRGTPHLGLEGSWELAYRDISGELVGLGSGFSPHPSFQPAPLPAAMHH